MAKPRHPGTTAKLEPAGPDGEKIGSAFDHLIGTWTEQEEESFLEAVKVFEEIDPAFWG